ncbi:4281_t:CDS:2 [Gigaspora margarita]|uniref:4281_t:CDS:1 n=1 Tax=Gigaspora margarita TaxID=4874 RepID=A0ABM8W1J6_GIGMA|nr:4281_t:CDS:2 [Gigaspora margarita]
MNQNEEINEMIFDALTLSNEQETNSVKSSAYKKEIHNFTKKHQSKINKEFKVSKNIKKNNNKHVDEHVDDIIESAPSILTEDDSMSLINDDLLIASCNSQFFFYKIQHHKLRAHTIVTPITSCGSFHITLIKNCKSTGTSSISLWVGTGTST